MLSKIYPLTRCSHRSMSTTMDSFYDIIIIGGGMVGNAMACALGLNDRLKLKKVLVLDSTEIKAPTKNSPYGNRVTAVSPPSVSLFKKLGIWNDLVDLRVKRVDRLQILDSCSHSSIRFAQPDPTNEVAYMIENNAIIGFLSNRIKANCPNVTIKTKAKVIDCRTPSGLNQFATVVLDDGTKLQTSLIIGADGAKSMVRDMLNFEYASWGYGQSAVVANLRVQAQASFPTENNCVAWERFTPSGPVALLPLTENMSSVTWSTSTEHAEELLSLSAEEFVDQLNEFLTTDIHQNFISNQFLSLTEQVLKGVFSVSEKPRLTFPTVLSLYEGTRAGFPLAFGHCDSYVILRAALIGDAAHRTHPLAGQGVNLGWSDVKILLSCLEQCVIDGGDLGCLTYLSDYDTQAQRRNVPVQVTCDWLNRLYLTSSTPLILIRSLGLNMVDRFTFLKQYIYMSMLVKKAKLEESSELSEIHKQDSIDEFSWPTSIEKYRLEEIIGNGSASIVYRSVCIERREICAVKRIDLENYDLAQLGEEIKTLKACRHPNIVDYYTSFYTGNVMWTVMQFLDRGSLRQIMDRIIKLMGGRRALQTGLLTEPVIATILKQVLNGLKYIHDSKFIHGDIKTSNILISSQGNVKLADFGTSVWIKSEERTRKCLPGTVCYMAPEIAVLYADDLKKDAYTFNIDIWSLGITALEMATGYPPYHNNSYNVIIKWIRQNDPPELKMYQSCDYRNYGRMYRQFLSSCLQKNAKERWAVKELMLHPFITTRARNHDYLIESLLVSPAYSQYVITSNNGQCSSTQFPPITDINEDLENPWANIEWDYNIMNYEAQEHQINNQINREIGYTPSMNPPSAEISMSMTVTRRKGKSGKFHTLLAPTELFYNCKYSIEEQVFQLVKQRRLEAKHMVIVAASLSKVATAAQRQNLEGKYFAFIIEKRERLAVVLRIGINVWCYTTDHRHKETKESLVMNV